MKNDRPINEIIDKYKKYYQKIEPTFSAALNEKIYFNMAGFKHLVFKNKHRRKNSAIYNRMVLVPLIKPVIRKSADIKETRKRIESIGERNTIKKHPLG